MCAAVKNVHHGDRQNIGAHATQISIQRRFHGAGAGPGTGHGNRQNGIGAELRFIGSAIQLDHGIINAPLVSGVQPLQRVGDLGVDVAYRCLHAFAQITMLVAITQLHSFVLAGGSAAGNSSAADRAISQSDLGFYRRITARIKNLTRMNVNYACIHRPLKETLMIASNKRRPQRGENYKRPGKIRGMRAQPEAPSAFRLRPLLLW